MNEATFFNFNQKNELKKIIDRLNDTINFNTLKKSKKNLQELYMKEHFFQKHCKLSHAEIEDLEKKNIIKCLSIKDEKYILTLKARLIGRYGIWDPSSETNKLLDDINREFFGKVLELSEESLEAREKVIIIGLLGLNAVSEEYKLNLHYIAKTANRETAFKEAIEQAINFIKDLGPEFQDMSLDKLWSGSWRGEGPILGRMSRINKIVPHTERIYKIHRTKGHHLDIVDKDGHVNDLNLKYILERIFDKRSLTHLEKKSLIEALIKIQKYEFKLFENKPPFNATTVRSDIKRIIESRL